MSESYNVYCDESCHLERDRKRAMVLGGIFCPSYRSHEVNEKIRSLKADHKMPAGFEIKWTKVSEQRLDFYTSIIDLFFSLDFLTFRAVIADKADLNHDLYNQDHDKWYFKMYYVMLEKKIEVGNSYNIYIDIKDTRSADKVRKLHDVLCNRFWDFECEMIQKIQTVRSHEVELLQLADLLIGMLSANVNSSITSFGKQHLIRYFRMKSMLDMRRNTPLWKNKVNWLVWPKGAI